MSSCPAVGPAAPRRDCGPVSRRPGAIAIGDRDMTAPMRAMAASIVAGAAFPTAAARAGARSPIPVSPEEQPRYPEGDAATPIGRDTMRYEIAGTVMQTVSIDLDRGESVFSQTHAMAWMTDGIAMATHTGGGFFAGLRRAATGGSLFITDYTADGRGQVAFAPRFPGRILPFELRPGETLICRKETFLCAQAGVSVDIAFQQRLGAGLFAGEGFILQRITGPGTVFLDLSGEVIEKTLGVGERLRVHAGHIGIQEPAVATDIQMVRGFRNILFGGEGLFLATLTGPGRIWLQSMPILNLAEEIARHLPSGESGGTRVGSGVGAALGGGAAGAAIGGILGGLFGNE